MQQNRYRLQFDCFAFEVLCTRVFLPLPKKSMATTRKQTTLQLSPRLMMSFFKLLSTSMGAVLQGTVLGAERGFHRGPTRSAKIVAHM